jgi:hypothetical protein
VTLTKEGLPGDPLNVGFLGMEEELIRAFLDAGWHPADPLTLRSSLHITASVLLDRSYKAAPVSTEFLWGREQDLAFEKPSGKSPTHRHHVRLWKWEGSSGAARPLWIGAATFDRSVGISHVTGKITHHISPDVDKERDLLMSDLTAGGQLEEIYQVTGIGMTLSGHNGGGDWYYTDGELTIGVISPGSEIVKKPPVVFPNPPAVQLKNQTWGLIHQVLRQPAVNQAVEEFMQTYETAAVPKGGS